MHDVDPTTSTFVASDELNDRGVKDCCDIYRTVAGERWSQYSDYPGDDRVKIYRAAGLRCRKLTMNDGYVALIMHPADWDRAGKLDAEAAPAAR
jgi:hypothetical protein